MGPRGLVIFIPPAVGGENEMREEAEGLERLGFATLLYRPPYRRHDPTYVFGDPVTEKNRWHQTVAEFDTLLEQARARGFTRDRIAVIGKNLGGSVGSYVSANKVACFIATGSIPMLSAFYRRSAHPVAVERRKGLTVESLVRFTQAIRSFDLASTVPEKSQVRVLAQFGTHDPWIETSDVNVFEGMVGRHQHVRWVNDDHSMNSKDAVAQRRDWIVQSLG